MAESTEAPREYKKALDLIVAASGHALPEGYDRWAMKSVKPDLRTRNGYRWPWPGKVAKAASPTVHDDPCPKHDGDGICVADTYAGMATGRYPATTLLLVAVKTKHVLADAGGKQRVSKCLVVDLLDGAAYARQYLRSADLRSANLWSADLRSADLWSADLRSADLRYADLWSADLWSADLRSADLWSANLRYANLWSANLRYANLWSANLRYADLRSANLWSANLRSATYNSSTVWPEGFDPAAAGAVKTDG